MRSSVLPALLLALALGACASPAYNKEFAQTTRADGQYSTLEGPWTGNWISEKSGHEGKLRCIVSKTEGSPDQYDFHYWANWATLLSAQYHVTYQVTEEDGIYKISAKHNLGKLLGDYTHSGVVTPTTFKSNYESEKDHGSFEMERP